ncbi:MAG: ABC transporter transmembrane domain-containing protein, partial [Bacteroidota bacterium]
MNTYLRILSHARPFSVILPQYIIYTVLYVLFSLVNFSILIPLLEILFDQVDADIINTNASLPKFSISIDYFSATFNYYFSLAINEYGRKGALQYVCAVIVISVFLANLFRYLSALLLAQFRIRVVTNLRNSIFQKLNSFHIGYYTEKKKGDIVSRVTTDILEVERSVVSTLKVLFKEPALII